MRVKNKQNLWELFIINEKDEVEKLDSAYINLLEQGKYNRNDLRLGWKILRDPFISKTYSTYKAIDKIIEAGFFDDRIEPNSYQSEPLDPNWITTPIGKVIENLAILKNKNTMPAVLLSTGGFSPIHAGHVQMMEIAKVELEKRGTIVIGGYLSPSHDDYVLNKYGGSSLRLDANYRINLCQNEVANSSWLMIDSWEARYNKVPLTYTDVLSRLEAYLSHHARRKIDVIYVFGSDNAFFSRTFIGKGKCVCVRRDGHEENINKVMNEPKIKDNKNIIFTSQLKTKPKISSSEIRQEMNTKKTMYRKKDKESLIYAIRDDGDWALAPIRAIKGTKNIKNEKNVFLLKLADILPNLFSESAIEDDGLNCKVQIVSQNSQQFLVNKLIKNKNVINLDVCTIGGYRLNLSRLFYLSDGQINPKAIIARPGYQGIKAQIKEIPMGQYILVDDDVANGFTTGKLLSNLPGRIKVTEVISLVKLSMKSEKSQNDEILLDIVDLRDFIIGSREGGLVVSLPNHQICRAPYLLPYVSLHSRAMIPSSKELYLSLLLWKLNADFYKNIGGKIVLSQTDPYFQKLMKYIGFSDNFLLVDICKWHIDQLLSGISPSLSSKNPFTLSAIDNFPIPSSSKETYA